MVKKNRDMNEASIIYEDFSENQIAAEITASTTQSNSFENLANLLDDICNPDEMMGYILKNDTAAKINLKDSSKVVDFAMLSSQAFDSAMDLSSCFNVGNINNIVIDASDIKVLCVNVNENAISIFMEKNADHNTILNKIFS